MRKDPNIKTKFPCCMCFPTRYIPNVNEIIPAIKV